LAAEVGRRPGALGGLPAALRCRLGAAGRSGQSSADVSEPLPLLSDPLSSSEWSCRTRPRGAGRRSPPVLSARGQGGASLRQGEAPFGPLLKEPKDHMPAQRHQTQSALHKVVYPRTEALDAPLIRAYGLLAALVRGAARVPLHVTARRAPCHLRQMVVVLADKMHHLARYRAHRADVHAQNSAVIGWDDQAVVGLPVGPNHGLCALVGRFCRLCRRRRAGCLRRGVTGAPSPTRSQSTHLDYRCGVIWHPEEQARHQVDLFVGRVAVLKDRAPR